MADFIKPVDYTSFCIQPDFEKRLNPNERLLAEGLQNAYPHTRPVYLTALALFGGSMLSPLIPAMPGKEYDYWDLYNKSLDTVGGRLSYLSICSEEDGLVNFVVTDETKGNVEPGDILRRPHVPSSGNLFMDTMSVRSAIVRYLRFSSRSLYSDPDPTIVEGPTEDQPFLVVQSKSGRAVGQQEGNNGIHNVKGLIFTPDARQAGDSIHGAVELW